MKIIYTNRAINRRKDPSPSLRTIILMTCVVLTMVAVKLIYNPTDTMDDVAAMAYSSTVSSEEETVEMQNAECRMQN